MIALFLIGLALPSIAVPVQAASVAATGCHEAMPNTGQHGQPDTDSGKGMDHICVGCIATASPSMLSATANAPVAAADALPPGPLAGAESPPRTPPPRA